MLQHQVILFCIGETFTDQPPICPPIDLPVNTRANAADLGGSVPKPGVEVNLGLVSLPGSLYSGIMHIAKYLTFSMFSTSFCISQQIYMFGHSEWFFFYG